MQQTVKTLVREVRCSDDAATVYASSSFRTLGRKEDYVGLAVRLLVLLIKFAQARRSC
jgi:hypothetical protein